MNTSRIFSVTKLSIFASALLCGAFFAAHTKAAVVTWDGGGGDNNWSTAENWSGDTQPGSGDIATFDGTSTKDATIDASFAGSVAGVDINSGYTGTITQARSLTIVGSAYNQDDGTFEGGAYDMDLSAGLIINAGTFTAPSSTLYVGGNFTVALGATFNPNSGTFVADGTGSTFNVNVTETFSNFTIDTNDNAITTLSSGDTFVIEGTLTLTDGRVNTGTWQVEGDVSVASTYDSGSATMTFANTNEQTFTSNDSDFPHDITINKASGTVTLGADLNMSSDQSLTVTSGEIDFDEYDLTMNGNVTVDGGTFTGGTGNMSITGVKTLTLSSGTFVAPSGVFTTYGPWTNSGGTFTHNDGTVKFMGSSRSINVDSTETFYDVVIEKTDNSDLDIASGDTLIITNDLVVVEGNFDDGTVQVQGDFTMDAGGDTPDLTDTAFQFTGGNTQTWSMSGATTILDGNITVNKSGGQVNLGSEVDLDASGQTLTIVEGTLDIAGQTFSVDGIGATFTVEDGGNFQLTGDETMSFTTLTLDSNSTVTYDATSGTRDIQNYNYQNLTIAGSGGTFTLPGTESVIGTFGISAGTFDANDEIFAINGNTMIAGGTFKTGTNEITFGDAGDDAVTITSGTLEIESDDTATDIVINASTWTNTGGTIRYAGSSVNTALLSALSPYNDLTILATSSIYTLDGDIEIDDDLTIDTGTLDVSGSNYDILIAGDFNGSDTFTAREGTVTFDDNGQTSLIVGDITWYDLTSTTANKAITVTAGDTQTVTGTLTLTGTDGNEIVLRSSSSGTQWNLDIDGSSSIDYVDVQDSDASAGSAITFASSSSNSIDSGNNLNWFPAASTSSSASPATFWLWTDVLDSDEETEEASEDDEEEDNGQDNDQEEDDQDQDETTSLDLPFSATSPVTGDVELISPVSVGDYIRGDSYSTVYYIGEDQTRRPFFDAQTFLTYQDDFDSVVTVTDATLSVITLGSPMLPKATTVLVKVQSDPKVYALEEQEDGTIALRWIPSEEMAIALYGSDWSEYIIDISSVLFPRFIQGEQMDVADLDTVSPEAMKTRVELNR